MESINLNQIPKPPSNKTGWPWTEETPPLPPTLPDGSPWPRISIVTPSYNQGQFIEETIRSVLLQGYPNLEYIIMDGDSTDATIEIINKYRPWLTYWVSESDQGQSDAINKGFQRATGDIFAWINSDDYYSQSAFCIVGESWSRQPFDWLVGVTRYVTVDGKFRGDFKPAWGNSPRKKDYQTGSWLDYLCVLYSGLTLPQPSSFWSKTAWQVVQGVENQFHYIMDHHLSIKLAHAGYRHDCEKAVLASFRLQPDQKSTHTIKFAIEQLKLIDQIIPTISGIKRQTLTHYRKEHLRSMQKIRSNEFRMNIIRRLKRVKRSLWSLFRLV